MLNALVTLAEKKRKEKRGGEPSYFQITTSGILKIIYTLCRESLYT